MAETKSDWRAISAQKIAARDALIPEEWKLKSPPDSSVKDVTDFPAQSGILNALELEITESPAELILAHIREGKWTAVQVTQGFCKRAAIAQQLVNCLSEIAFDEALARAHELDQIYATNGGRAIGPLHGLPISIKDNFKIKGLDSTLGFITWANKPLDEDSVLITLLRNAGAVLYCKTNVPTAMMIAETYNNVFQRTLNPYNRDLSSGGSSGGEAALLALRGSPLGVGTDIGGSIRIPGAFCGLYSLRPSFGRFPTYGARSGMAGQEGINSVNGPLSHTLATLSTFAEAVINHGQPWLHDPKTLPIPWRKVELPVKLSFGIIRHDGVVRPHPPVARALDTVVDALRKAGHEVLDFEPYDHAHASDLLSKCFHADGGISIRKLIHASGEDWPLGLKDYDGGERFHPSTYEMWQILLEKNAYCKEYLDRWVKTRDVTSTGREMDVIICPTTPFAAVPHDTFEHVGYTGVWNVVDYPAATIPVLRADPAIDVVTPSYQSYTPVGELDARVWKRYIDDPAAYSGGPVSVQIIGKRLEEEKVLAVCRVVEDALKAVGINAAEIFGPPVSGLAT